MRTGAEPGAALISDPLPLANALAVADGESRHVAVEGHKTIGVDDDHVVAVAGVAGVGVCDAAVGRIDLAAIRTSDVNPGVEATRTGAAGSLRVAGVARRWR